MKLPEKILGRDRIRNAEIVVCFKRRDMDVPQLAEKFKLTERRIQQILSKNHAFVKRDKEWEKEKRIARLNRWLQKRTETVRDPIEIQAELRKEIEGEDGGRTNETKVIIIRESNGNTNSQGRVPGSVSVLRV